jgi:hypothetical protein
MKITSGEGVRVFAYTTFWSTLFSNCWQATKNTMSIMLSHSYDGVFLEPTSFLAALVPGEMIVADFNGDRKPDMATTDVATKSLSVRLNGHLPVLTGVSPAQGRIGDVLTLTGRHFGKRGVVQFGGKAVTAYVSWDVSKIKVRVPRGTPRGRVRVTVTTLIGRSAPRPYSRLWRPTREIGITRGLIWSRPALGVHSIPYEDRARGRGRVTAATRRGPVRWAMDVTPRGPTGPRCRP